MSYRNLPNSCVLTVAVAAISMCSCTALRQSPAVDLPPANPRLHTARSMEPSRVAQLGNPQNAVTHNASEAVVRAIKPLAPATTVSFSPAEARVGYDQSKFQRIADTQDGQQFSDIDGPPSENYPDEYIFDGGDRNDPIHYGIYNRLGFDTEDTIAEFQDDEGERYTKTTNRVAIYAPRFGSLRTVSMPTGGHSIDKLATTQDMKISAGASSRVASNMHQQRNGLKGIRVRSRASGLNAKTLDTQVHNIARLESRTKLINLYEEVAFQVGGGLSKADEASLNLGIQAANAWAHDQRAVISAVNESLGETYSSSTAAQYVGLEIDHKTKGNLRILKLADKKIAKQGDEITFTILYANTGEKELNNIRIVDNLTPRLEYIEDSAGSDRAGRITTTENDEGSVILTFELDDPLPGHTAGEISFKCRVR